MCGRRVPWPRTGCSARSAPGRSFGRRWPAASRSRRAASPPRRRERRSQPPVREPPGAGRRLRARCRRTRSRAAADGPARRGDLVEAVAAPFAVGDRLAGPPGAQRSESSASRCWPRLVALVPEGLALTRLVDADHEAEQQSARESWSIWARDLARVRGLRPSGTTLAPNFSVEVAAAAKDRPTIGSSVGASGMSDNHTVSNPSGSRVATSSRRRPRYSRRRAGDRNGEADLHGPMLPAGAGYPRLGAFCGP